MLVLARNIGESVVIDDGSIVVTVLKIVGSQVRIGITAPRDVDVHRQEVHVRRQREKADAAYRAFD